MATKTANRETADRLVTFIGDDSGSFRNPAGRPCDAPTVRDWLIGWDNLPVSGPDALFVRVRSYLPNTTLSRDEAVNIAVNGLADLRYFTTRESTTPDHIIAPDPIVSPPFCRGIGLRSGSGCGRELTSREAAQGGGLCPDCLRKASL